MEETKNKKQDSDLNLDRNPRRIPTSELLKDLEKVAEEVDGKLSFNQYREKGEYHPRTIGFRFGSWNKAKEMIGLETHNYRESAERDYSREQILEEIQTAFEKTEGILTARDFKQHSDIHPRTIGFRFGSWLEAKEQAGISDDEIERMFELWEDKLAGKYGRFYMKEIQKFLPGYCTRYWKSFLEWIEDSDKVDVRNPKPNSQQGRRHIFVRPKGKDYGEVLEDRYGDMVELEYFHIVRELVGQGMKPASVVAAVNYITGDDVTQAEVADECGVTTVSVRNARDRVFEEGFFPEKQ